MKTALTVGLVLLLAVGCVTQARQNLYDQGSDSAKQLADVLGRYQATTIDNALAAAAKGEQMWTERRGAFLVEETTKNNLDDPFTIRILAWYDNVIASVKADIVFLNGLKTKAAAAGVKPAPAK